jgi:tRNA (guanine10-N2)-dimethyltransferase
MHILELSMENKGLSIAEAQSLLKFPDYNIKKRFLFIDKINKDMLKRLAYTKSCYKLIFSCPSDKLIEVIHEYDFKKIIKGSYKIFHENIGSEKLKKEINSAIWKSLKDPKVEMRNPTNPLYFIRIDDSIYCCLQEFVNKEDFTQRLPHKRAGFRPISLHPKLAKALVNLSGCKKGTIIDPFTGISGILIEALLCGLKVEGYDIDPVMIRISEYNLLDMEFSRKNFKLAKKDFFKSKAKINYLVTDLPYGKNTKSIDLDFYTHFMSQLDKILKKRAVVVFPGKIDISALMKYGPTLKLVDLFDNYVHGSMTRIICVIEKK